MHTNDWSRSPLNQKTMKKNTKKRRKIMQWLEWRRNNHQHKRLMVHRPSEMPFYLLIGIVPTFEITSLSQSFRHIFATLDTYILFVPILNQQLCGYTALHWCITMYYGLWIESIWWTTRPNINNLMNIYIICVFVWSSIGFQNQRRYGRSTI